MGAWLLVAVFIGAYMWSVAKLARAGWPREQQLISFVVRPPSLAQARGRSRDRSRRSAAARSGGLELRRR